MEEKNSIVATWTSRLTKDFQSFCVDRCLCCDLESLPTEIKTTGGKAWILISGNDLPKIKGIGVRYYGVWNRHPKYGYQFKATSYEIVPPKGQRAIVAYLSSALFKGIGKRLAEKIVRVFGNDALEVIVNHPEELERLIGRSKARTIIKEYNNSVSCSKLFELLGKYGVSQNGILKIYEKFGSSSVAVVEFTPYRLQEAGLSYLVCDRIAISNGVALDSYDRIASCIKYNLSRMEDQSGSTYFDAKKVKEETLKFLNKEKDVVSSTTYDEKFVAACKNKEIVAFKFQNNNMYVMNNATNAAEKAVAKKLVPMSMNDVGERKKKLIKKRIDNYNKYSSIQLSDKQKQAVENSLSFHASIITGGPGTGKTTIITAIINVYEEVFGGQVTLLAPTGKAARRMSEATKREAKTIHSCLGIYDGEGDSDINSLKAINSGLVIVDETSMVDVFVMTKLCQAINDKVHIILVGDVDQLPSVGAGNVLSQLISSDVITTTRLTEIFRQKEGGTIVKNAIRINHGIEAIEENNNDFIVIKANSEEEAKNRIVDVYKKEVETNGIDNVAVLCPLRKTQEGRYLCSSDGLNPVIQDCVNPRDNYSKAYKAANGIEYRINDRVLQWKNCKTSYNGDIGVVKNIKEDESGCVELSIEWDNGNTVVVSKEDLSSITLGYSMSIHKSQGSEYKTVIIPMLKEQSRCPLFKRNLLYTGVTRAKTKVVLIGDEYTIKKCIREKDSNKRNSFLANRMKGGKQLCLAK